MNELLQKVLTDPAARSEATLSTVAAESSSKFLPWDSIAED
jgi:hypothetical protein